MSPTQSTKDASCQQTTAYFTYYQLSGPDMRTGHKSHNEAYGVERLIK